MLSFGKSSGFASSPGVLSTSTGGVLPGFVSSSAILISESFKIVVPVKAGSIWNVIVTVLEPKAGMNGIGLFNVATAPAAVQFASAKIKPAGI